MEIQLIIMSRKFVMIKGHKVIDVEKLNNFLKKWFDFSFQRNFIAYKIAEHEDEFIKTEKITQLEKENQELRARPLTVSFSPKQSEIQIGEMGKMIQSLKLQLSEARYFIQEVMDHNTTCSPRNKIEWMIRLADKFLSTTIDYSALVEAYGECVSVMHRLIRYGDGFPETDMNDGHQLVVDALTKLKQSQEGV